MLNQCDGCSLGWPVMDNTHYNPETKHGHMICTADLYKEPISRCPKCGAWVSEVCADMSKCTVVIIEEN